jgi:ferredoxin
MRISVDTDVCDLHGQCVFVAPQLFRFEDDGELAYTVSAPPDLERQAREAVAVCPTNAITLHS